MHMKSVHEKTVLHLLIVFFAGDMKEAATVTYVRISLLGHKWFVSPCCATCLCGSQIVWVVSAAVDLVAAEG